MRDGTDPRLERVDHLAATLIVDEHADGVGSVVRSPGLPLELATARVEPHALRRVDQLVPDLVAVRIVDLDPIAEDARPGRPRP